MKGTALEAIAAASAESLRMHPLNDLFDRPVVVGIDWGSGPDLQATAFFRNGELISIETESPPCQQHSGSGMSAMKDITDIATVTRK